LGVGGAGENPEMIEVQKLETKVLVYQGTARWGREVSKDEIN